MSKSFRRYSFVTSFLYSLYSSLLCRYLFFHTFSTVFIFVNYHKPIYKFNFVVCLIFYCVSVAVSSYLFIRKLIFELCLLIHVAQLKFGSFDWFNKIEDKIILGALPLVSLSHLSILTM